MNCNVILRAACLGTIALAGCSNPTPQPPISQKTAVPSPTAPTPTVQEPPSQSKTASTPVKPSSLIDKSKTSSLKSTLETYTSQVFGQERTYGVVLPPDYDRNPQKQYPVVFLLHGGHGDPTAWFQKGKALAVIEQVYASGKLPPSIIITPDGNDNRGSSPYWDPQYIDGKNGNVLSAIGDELVQVIKSRYRVRPEREYWAIGGLSSGGWGAVNIGLHHVKNFGTLFSHSGYFTDVSGAENSPLQYVQQLSPEERRSVAIYLDAGEGDGVYLEQSREFHQTLNQLQVENRFNEFPGGHGVHGQDVGWGFWRKHLADSLSYVGDRFRTAETLSRR